MAEVPKVKTTHLAARFTRTQTLKAGQGSKVLFRSEPLLRTSWVRSTGALGATGITEHVVGCYVCF
jgi:hypothetical protein